MLALSASDIRLACRCTAIRIVRVCSCTLAHSPVCLHTTYCTPYSVAMVHDLQALAANQVPDGHRATHVQCFMPQKFLTDQMVSEPAYCTARMFLREMHPEKLHVVTFDGKHSPRFASHPGDMLLPQCLLYAVCSSSVGDHSRQCCSVSLGLNTLHGCSTFSTRNPSKHGMLSCSYWSACTRQSQSQALLHCS